MQATRMIKRALERAEATGAIAGAALPAASLLQYHTQDLPTYRRVLNAAPEVSYDQLKKVLRPGDYGLGGMYPQSDPLTAYLNFGSMSMSGGPGTHGQLVGPRVERWVNPQGSVGDLDMTPRAAARGGYVRKRVPTLFHGGQHGAVNIWGAGRRYLEALPQALSPELATEKPSLGEWTRGFFSNLHKAPGRYRDMINEDVAETNKAFASRGKKYLLNKAEALAEDVDYYKKVKRPFLYMRSKDGPLRMTSPQGKAYRKLLLREAVAPYDIFGATGAGIKSVLMPRMPDMPGAGVNTLKQELANAGGNVAQAVKRIQCDATGHHCGSMPAAIMQRLNLAPRNVSARGSLPATMLLSNQLKPVAVVEKAKMLAGLRRAALARTGLGLAATAGGGYLGSKMMGALLPAQGFRDKIQAALQRKLAG